MALDLASSAVSPKRDEIIRAHENHGNTLPLQIALEELYQRSLAGPLPSDKQICHMRRLAWMVTRIGKAAVGTDSVNSAVRLPNDAMG